jgi:hypothetical protein
MAPTLFPLQFKRQQAAPIDTDSVFEFTADRIAYLTNARRYAGQLASDLEDGKVYVMNNDLTDWIPLIPVMVFSTTSARIAYLSNSARFPGLLGIDQQEDRVYYINTSNDDWLLVNRPKVIVLNQAAVVMTSAHFDNILDFQYTSATTYTLNETVGSYTPAGVAIVLVWSGIGQVTIVPGTNCTITTPETYSIRKRYGQVSLFSKGNGIWTLEGNLTPA